MAVLLPPQSEDELMQRASALLGLTLGQLAEQSVGINFFHKGWIGNLLEIALGAEATSAPVPDFKAISVELKTLPIGRHGKPCESTFITSINLLKINQETWETSIVYSKLKRVLWVPIEGDPQIPLLQRRIGTPILWSPNVTQQKFLRQDWEELTNFIALGCLETITAHHGKYLQIRPKAADGKSLCNGIDAQGNKIQTLPRGFYLRTLFTQHILES